MFDKCSTDNLFIKVLTDSSTAVSIENYEIIIISRSDFRPMLTCMCRVSFLTTLDIYKVYFEGCHIREYKGNTCKKWPSALVSLKEVTVSFAPYGFVTKYFLIFIIDEVKNFATNNLHQVGKLVTYWKSCIIGQSRTGICAKRLRLYIEEFKGSEAIEGFCYKFIYGDYRV